MWNKTSSLERENQVDLSKWLSLFKTCSSKLAAVSVSMEIGPIKCCWSTFRKGSNTGRGKKNKMKWRAELCPHHLPLKWFILSLLISSHTCKMTSESCLCLYLPLPSDTGLYTDWIRARKRKGGIRRRDNKARERDRKKTAKPNKISVLNFRQWV